MRSFKLATILGLNIIVTPPAVYATLLLWVGLSGVAIGLLEVAPLPAVLGGLAAALLHWIGELWHQFGHAWAARSTGYPMTGVRLWTLLGISLYPRDEPPLPAATHIRRALGGPAASLLMTLVAAVITRLLQPAGGVAYLVALFFFLD
ncbi:MAG: hypothetical protein L0322_27315, partial [Chloroflexi bacterium]|nr:hypothetical protein [Chloroflexota bacterium]